MALFGTVQHTVELQCAGCVTWLYILFFNRASIQMWILSFKLDIADDQRGKVVLVKVASRG